MCAVARRGAMARGVVALALFALAYVLPQFAHAGVFDDDEARKRIAATNLRLDQLQKDLEERLVDARAAVEERRVGRPRQQCRRIEDRCRQDPRPDRSADVRARPGAKTAEGPVRRSRCAAAQAGRTAGWHHRRRSRRCDGGQCNAGLRRRRRRAAVRRRATLVRRRARPVQARRFPGRHHRLHGVREELSQERAGVVGAILDRQRAISRARTTRRPSRRSASCC